MNPWPEVGQPGCEAWLIASYSPARNLHSSTHGKRPSETGKSRALCTRRRHCDSNEEEAGSPHWSPRILALLISKSVPSCCESRTPHSASRLGNPTRACTFTRRRALCSPKLQQKQANCELNVHVKVNMVTSCSVGGVPTGEPTGIWAGRLVGTVRNLQTRPTYHRN